MRTAFFPAVAVWDGVSALANKVRGKGAPASHAAGWLKKRWKNAVGYGLMLAALSTRTLTYDDVDRYVDKIQSAPVHRVILVDGFKSDRALSQVLQYRLKTRYAGTREVYVVSAADRATMLHALRQLTDDVGAADRLEFHGHGIPGQMDINGEAISKGSFRVSRIEMDEHGLDAEEFPMQTDESGFEMPGDAEMRGIVKDGGVIAAYSCDAAAGEEGQELLEYLHDTFPESSRVVGLTKVLNPLFLENAYVATLWTEGKEPPAWLADVAWAVDPLLAGPRLFSFVARSQPFQKDPAPIGTPAISGFAVFEARE